MVVEEKESGERYVTEITLDASIIFNVLEVNYDGDFLILQAKNPKVLVYPVPPLKPFYFAGSPDLSLSYDHRSNIAEIRMKKDMRNMIPAAHQVAYNLFLKSIGTTVSTDNPEFSRLIKLVSLL